MGLVVGMGSKVLERALGDFADVGAADVVVREVLDVRELFADCVRKVLDVRELFAVDCVRLLSRRDWMAVRFTDVVLNMGGDVGEYVAASWIWWSWPKVCVAFKFADIIATTGVELRNVIAAACTGWPWPRDWVAAGIAGVL